MSSANRTQIRYGKETTWGEVPAIAFKNFPDKSDSLGFNINTVQSETIRSDRKIADLIQTGAAPGGSVEFELAFGGCDDFMTSALYNDWTSDLSISGSDISFANADNSINASSTDLSSIKPGQWFEVDGSTNNDGYWQATSVTSSKVIVAGGTIDDESSGNTIDITGSSLFDGTTETSFTIEREHADVGQFFHWTGMVANEMAIQVAANSVLTGSFTFVGKGASRTTSTVGTGTPTDATTKDVMNAVANVGQIMEGGVPLTDRFIQAVNFTVSNNVRGLSAIGVLGNADLAEGDCDVKGTMNLYFADGEMYDKFLNNTDSSFSFRVEKDGDVYIFDFPRIKFSSDDIKVAGRNQDVVENMGFQAILHHGYGYTIQVARFAA